MACIFMIECSNFLYIFWAEKVLCAVCILMVFRWIIIFFTDGDVVEVVVGAVCIVGPQEGH